MRFPEFTDEWGKYKLSDVCSFFSGGTPSSSKKEYYDGSIPFIRSGELHMNKTELFITEEGLNNSAAKMVEIGDLLLALYGATSGDIAIGQIKGAINQAILCIRTTQNKKFIESVWKKHVEKLLQTYLQGGQGNLSADIVKNISFYFANSSEQMKLAKFISLLDERIATQNKIIEKYESLIQAMCDALIESEQHKVKLSFNDFGEPYSGLLGKSAEDFGEGCPYITYMNVYQNQIIDTANVGLVKINETEQQSVVHYGDILFTLSSETAEEVGMGAVYLGDTYPLYLNSFCFGIHIIDENKIFPPFLAFYVSTKSFRKVVFPLAQGSTRFNLQKNDFMKKVFSFPTVERQRKIYSALKTYSDKLSVEKSIAKLLCEQKNHLLSQLFI
ncbi:restriction endonuclease subunit S [Bacteroides uniformis]|uniref:restriction endonuclease subunit S n=1 Tax=Bacteroides uniformis TaxID=820 RepID=UPI0039B3AEDE